MNCFINQTPCYKEEVRDGKFKFETEKGGEQN